MKQSTFSIQKRFKSFGYAFKGLSILIREEHNAGIHLIAAISVMIAGFFLRISTMEWIGVVLAIGLVITLEIINSVIENIADFVSPEKNEMIGKIKDLSAAGVLVGAITSLIVGLIVFVPKLINL
jgi:diacylglycerol kinase